MPRSLTLAALALVAATGLAQDRDGEVFKSEAGKFGVWLPGKPRAQTKTLAGPAGKAEVHAFSLDQGDRGYSVGYTDYPPASVTDDIRQDLLDHIRDGSAAAVQGRVTAESKITIGKQKVQGRDFLIESGRSVSRSRIFLKGNRLYQLVASGPFKEWLASAAVTKFFDSFAIEE
jgi:hypothetical protein